MRLRAKDLSFCLPHSLAPSPFPLACPVLACTKLTRRDKSKGGRGWWTGCGRDIRMKEGVLDKLSELILPLFCSSLCGCVELKLLW